MAFPTIPTTAAGRVLTAVQADTQAPRTFPNLSGLTKASGDLLIAIVTGYQSTVTDAAFSNWSSGWTEFIDFSSSTNLAIGAAYKWSTGSETGTISTTQAATITGHAAMMLLSIPGVHPSTPPEVGGGNIGTTTAVDPSVVDPVGWGAEDTLWIAIAESGETATTGSYTGITAAPTNFTDFVATAISADVVGGVQLAAAFRQLNAATLDAGPFAVDTSNARNAALIIAVRPSPVSAPTVNAGADAAVTANTAFARTASETLNGGTASARAWTIQAGPAGVGSTIGTAAALSWTPTVAGSYTLRYSLTTEGGTGTDDVTVTVTSAAVLTSVRVSFPTPGFALSTAQEFRALVRRKEVSAPTTDPTVAIELWESGAKIADVVTGVAVPSTTGQVVSGTWSSAVLTTVDGSAVECRVFSAGTSGGTVEVGAIEWNAAVTDVPVVTFTPRGAFFPFMYA